MKKRIILVIGIAVLLLAGIVSVGIINQINSTTPNYDLKAYTYNPVTVVDNRIKNQDNYLLPFIFETPDDRINRSYLEAEFAKAKLTIKSISTTKIGTGTIIETNEDAIPYQVLIYGDVNGDGKVGLADSQDIMEMYLNPDAQEKQLTGIYFEAANVRNDDNKVNLVDAQRIVDFYLENITQLLSELPEDDRIVKIEVVVSDDTKLEYNYGEELDLTNVKVRRVTASGKPCVIEDLPENCISGYNANIAGYQALNVSYAGFNTTLNVKVLEKTTHLIIDQSCKTQDASIGNQVILGTIKQAEGESSFDINDLKTQVTKAGTDEPTTGVNVIYKPRHEVFDDCTDENKDDIVIIGTGIKEGEYEINPYLGDNFENADAKSQDGVIIEITNTTTVNKIQINGKVQVVYGNSWTAAETSEGQKVHKVVKKVQENNETVYYTLLPVEFKDQNGNKISLKPSDFEGYKNGEAFKLTVSDNYGYNIPGLDVKIFRIDANNNIVEAGGDNTFDYIGFAIVHNANIDDMKQKEGTVTITYGPSNLVSSVKATLKVELVTE